MRSVLVLLVISAFPIVSHCWEDKDLSHEIDSDSGIVDNFSGNLKLSDASDGELAVTDHFSEESSLTAGSDLCSENPKPNGKLRARGKICPVRKPPKTQHNPAVEESKKDAPTGFRRPDPFPVKPWTNSRAKSNLCRSLTGDVLPIAICTTPKSEVKWSILEVNSGNTLWVSFGALGKLLSSDFGLFDFREPKS